MFLEPDTTQFGEYIKKKYVMQRWWLSDPMCPIEEQFWDWLELLEFFNELKYPIRLSSKSDLPLRDPRYLEAFRKWAEHIAFMSSIITADEKIAEKLEAGTPSPERRFQTLKALSDVGVYTILRLRPYIVGITDKSVKQLVKRASECWVKAISTEFFCLEARAPDWIKAKFKVISSMTGFDIWDYYAKNANTMWYRRLERKVTQPFIDELINEANKYGIKVSISCPKNKHQNWSSSCCGMPDCHPILWAFHRGQFTHALKIAEKKWYVEWNDIASQSIFQKVSLISDWIKNIRTKAKWKYRAMSALEYMREVWNNPKGQSSPYKLFEWVLLPKGVDKDGNVVYIYNKQYQNAKRTDQ